MKLTTTILASFFCIFYFSSCASQKWSAISENANTEQILQQQFPQLYSKSKSGEIVITKMEQRVEKNGEIKYRVIIGEKNNNDDDSYIWDTIYRPSMD